MKVRSIGRSDIVLFLVANYGLKITFGRDVSSLISCKAISQGWVLEARRGEESR